MLSIFQKTFLIFLFVITLVSCSQEQPKPADINTIPEIVMGGHEGVFRGANLGDNLDAVLKKETTKPIETDSGYLYYEFPLFDSIGSYNVTYNFDEKGLFEIQSTVFIINNPAETENVFNRFKAYFDKTYGASESEMGFNVWSVKSEKFGNVKINLSDESSDFTIANSPGKLSIWIYKDQGNS